MAKVPTKAITFISLRHFWSVPCKNLLEAPQSLSLSFDLQHYRPPAVKLYIWAAGEIMALNFPGVLPADYDEIALPLVKVEHDDGL